MPGLSINRTADRPCIHTVHLRWQIGHTDPSASGRRLLCYTDPSVERSFHLGKARPMFRRLHARRHDSRGAAAVEFALVLPVLVALVFGIIQYGIYFWARQSAVAAAREGVRRASVGDYADCTAFRNFVKGQLSGDETGT